MKGTYTRIKSFYSPDLEFHILLCRPFWLPREFTAITVTAVYIPPQANTDKALLGTVREYKWAGNLYCTGPLLRSFPGRLQIPPLPTFRQIGSLFRSTPAYL